MTQTAESESGRFEEAVSAEISADDLAKDRAALGKWAASRNQEWISTATPEAIRNFAHSYGDDNPLFTDPDYGPRTRWGSQVAPQIMAAVLNAPLRGDRLPKE
ncbi:hypothetical protein MPHLEI_03618, partial [Mycolicibacterium phlei RIVM601174]